MIIKKSISSTLSQLAGRSPNFILPLAFLGKFGGSEKSDILFLAFSLAFFFGTTLSNAASDAFVAQLKEGERRETAKQWLYTILLLASVSFVLALLLAETVGSYELAIALISTLLVVVGLVSAFQVSQLYVNGDFVTPGVTWAIRWIAIIPIIILDEVGEAAILFYALVLMADVLRLLVLRYKVKRRFSSSIPLKLPVMETAAVLWFMFSASMSGLNPVVDRLLASWLPSGGVSQLEFVERVASLFLLIPTIGVMQVINVEINKKIQENPSFRFDSMLMVWFIAASFWSLFCFLFLIYFFDYIIELTGIELWVGMKELVPSVLILIASAPSMFVGMICVRFLLGLKKSQVVLIYSVCSLFFNAFVSAPLSWVFGVKGILMGTLLTYSLTGVLLIFHCSKAQSSVSHIPLQRP